MDNPGDPDDVRQCRLLVYFIHDLLPGQLGPQNVQIFGENVFRVEKSRSSRSLKKAMFPRPEIPRSCWFK